MKPCMKEERAFINEYCQLCRACMSVCPEGAIKEYGEAGDAAPADAAGLAVFKGVMVFAEQREGKTSQVGFELLGAGRKLADALGVELTAALFGADAEQARELIRWGADKVYHCDDPALKSFNDEPYTALLAEVINTHRPEIVLAGATSVGRSFFPRVAVRLKAGLTADCTALDIEEPKEPGGIKNLLAIRPAFGGNIMAVIVCPSTRPQMATVRPRVMKKGVYDAARKGEIIPLKAPACKVRTRVTAVIKEDAGLSVNLQEAEVIVSGGRGLGGPKGFEILKELAALVNGTLGASRAAVDEGWIQYGHQVGQTGKTVCPRIYISCGISGAVQHLVGMQSSDVIIAINKHADAPIFNVASYGVVGDVFEVLPLLIKKIKEEKGLQ
jgi:electron transfer flavoprotein alpha subunit